MTDPQPSSRRRWVMPLLGTSLLLNMLIVGAIGGFVLSNRGDGPKSRIEGPARSIVGMPFIRALEPDNRRALNAQIRAESDQLRENRAALRARFEAFLGALKAEPFDPNAVRAILREQREVAVRRQDIGERLLIAELTRMTPEARAAYADRLARDLRNLRRE